MKKQRFIPCIEGDGEGLMLSERKLALNHEIISDSVFVILFELHLDYR